MTNECLLVDLIYQGLRRLGMGNPAINDVSFDGDHKSCEVIITLDDGQQLRDYVISSKAVHESYRDYDESQ